MSHGRNNADDKKVLQLKDTIGVSGDYCSQNLKNDDYEQDVVDRLNHSGWKERVGFEHSHDREVECGGGDGKKKDAENDVKDFFDSLDPAARHNELVLFDFLCHD